ncbi:DNA-directed RNA polymerase subunit omega [Tissierella carlieri]|jgi:DNA-directed RNA polymerase subunit omega|uniref:DNA-directed RNA polymerase subunit omega n=1 Tax=Tissierella carlieri TaxID=689904 RepID=A0ABT1S5W2_9FIRM|nr:MULTISPECIES: DNA-directed RNA polymerase subunit omega [Tissierella]MBU5314170.1 DNA-directed RNA polymerase subunit omega [Tissierella carlieri]MCQ4921850.1 DNA-directed RNA polymerase subunit omega [Tissierella carlieri]MDU5083142.1 DNA-directed RNA polymerase subunit omega [Bacillota bacterium]OZV12850.1 DNA-directed RNA polymerase subunit omega [Tissierella sp. P1]
MLNPSFNELGKRGDSRYTLVMLTAKRARKIIEGAEPLVETNSKKPVSIALEEVLEGKITYTRPPINSIK